LDDVVRVACAWGVDQYRAEVEHDAGFVQCVYEQRYWAVGWTPMPGNLGKGLLEPTSKRAIVLLGDAGAELFLQPAISQADGFLPCGAHGEQAVAHPHIDIKGERTLPVGLQYVGAKRHGGA